MTKLLTILVAFLMTVSTQASTQDMTYSDLKNFRVSVFIADAAKDACWTNLTESREYAEEKVRSAGATVVPHASIPDYVVVVRVRSVRDTAFGSCFGSISVELLTSTMVNGRRHEATAIESGAIFMGLQNANPRVIQSIQSFFDLYKARED